MVEIRPATLKDIPALVAMGRMLHAESPRYAALNYNADKVALLAELSLPAGGTLVAVKEGTIIGVIAGFVCPHWFGDDLIASDYTFYVAPSERLTGVAIHLLRAFEAWAKSQGAKDIVPGISTSITTERTAKFYEKMGYERTGFALFKRIG